MNSFRHLLTLPKPLRFGILLGFIALLWFAWQYFDSQANQSVQKYELLAIELEAIQATFKEQSQLFNSLPPDQLLKESLDYLRTIPAQAQATYFLKTFDIIEEIVGKVYRKKIVLLSRKMSTLEDLLPVEAEALRLTDKAVVVIGDHNSHRVGIFFSEDVNQIGNLAFSGYMTLSLPGFDNTGMVELGIEQQTTKRIIDEEISKTILPIKEQRPNLDDGQSYALMAFVVQWKTDTFRYTANLDKGANQFRALAQLCKLSTIPLALLALLILKSGFAKDFRWLVLQQMRLYGLDAETTFQLLFKKFKSDWKQGKNIEALCKQLSKECARICRAELAQRKKLRQESTKELLSETPPPSKQESFRSDVINLRLSVSEPSKLHSIAESLFDRVLEQQVKKEEKSPRLALLHRIKGCAYSLRNADAVEITALTVLAQEIRTLKRYLSKDAWKKFCEVFDGAEPQTYTDILGLTKEKKWAELEEILLPAKPPSQPASAKPAKVWPKILEGKSVLLVGGDPYPFYAEQLLSLGARSVNHLTGGDTLKRLQNARADIVFFLYRRASHKLFDLASQVGEFIPIDKRGKNTFLPDVIEQFMLYHQDKIAA